MDMTADLNFIIASICAELARWVKQCIATFIYANYDIVNME